jgi:hypothetical protein
MDLPTLNITKQERTLLRKLAGAAWEAELKSELKNLFEDFRKWADDGMDSFDLSDKIHEFHNGVSRELYGRYTRLDPEITVPRAVAMGILDEEALGQALVEKLRAQIDLYRKRLSD